MKSTGWFRRHAPVSLALRAVLSCLLAFQYAIPFAHSAPGVPLLINFQGRLTNAGNQPRNGTFTFKFAIYDAVSNGAKLWPSATENHTITVVNGVFSIVLGDGGEAIPSSIFAQDQAYVQVIVNDGGGDETLTPRQRLLAVPYAMNTERFDGFPGGYYVSTGAVSQNIEGVKVFLGTITVPTPTQAGHAVTKAYVDNITGGGIVIDLTASTQTKTGGINAFGYFGAGTTSPSTQLHVFRGPGSRGPQMIVSTGTFKLFEVNGASVVTNVPLGFSDGSVQHTAYPGSSGFIDTTASTQAKTGGMVAYGKIGIGTPTPAAQVEIRATGNSFPDTWNDNLKLTGVFPALWLKDTSSDDGFYFGADAGSLRLGYENAGTHQGYLMAVRSDGTMGVGTLAPSSKLHVFSAAGSAGPQMIVSTGTTSLFEVNGTSIVANVPIFSIGGGSYLDSSVSTQSKTGGLNISGRLGLGTSSPSTLLHVYRGAAVPGPQLIVSTGATELFEVSGASVSVGVPFGFPDGSFQYTAYPGASGFLDTTGTGQTKSGALSVGGIFSATSNTGLGTITPNSRLHVFSAAATVGPQMAVTTGTIRLFEVNGASIVANVSYFGSGGLSAMGRVGLGTFSPDARLHSLSAAGTSGPQMIVSTGTTKIFEINGASIAANSAMYMNGILSVTGRTGLGTLVPDARLHTLSAAGTVGPQMIISTGTTKLFEVNGASIVANVPLRFPDGSLQTTAYTGAGFITATSADTLTNKTIGSTGLVFSGATSDITTVSNEHLAIMPNGSGKVGIGSTSPSSLFDILDGSITVRGTNMGLQVGAATFVVQSGGRVGVGTNAPSSQFDVVGGSISIRGSNLGLQVGATNFVVQSGGNVGIGTINPSANFFVVGTSSVTGKLVGLDTTNQVYAVYAP